MNTVNNNFIFIIKHTWLAILIGLIIGNLLGGFSFIRFSGSALLVATIVYLMAIIVTHLDKT